MTTKQKDVDLAGMTTNKMNISNISSPRTIAEAALAEGMKRRDADKDAANAKLVGDNTSVSSTKVSKRSLSNRMEDTSSDEEGLLDNATNTSKRQRNESLYESSEKDGADGKLSEMNHKALQSRKNNQIQESLDNVWKQLDDNLTEMTNGDENDGEKAGQTPKSSSSSHGTQLTTPSSIHPKFYSALDQTRELLQEQFQHVWDFGLHAVDALEVMSREYKQLKQAHQEQTRDLERLKSSDAESRTSLMNLLQAVETSKTNTRDATRAVQTEARLRKELVNVKSQRDDAMSESVQAQRRVAMLTDEVESWKCKAERLKKEKMRVEQDSRNALSLARSMDCHAAADTDFYKRKVAELNEHLHAKSTLISELELQVNEYKRRAERSSAQTRIAQIQAEGPPSTQRRRKKRVAGS